MRLRVKEKEWDRGTKNDRGNEIFKWKWKVKTRN